MNLITVDLDEIAPADLDRLVTQQRRLQAARKVEPELYAAIVSRLESVTPEEAAQVRAELGHAVRPSAVLAGHWRTLIPDRPALGFYLKPKVA
jgi:hypothetical protein